MRAALCALACAAGWLGGAAAAIAGSAEAVQAYAAGDYEEAVRQAQAALRDGDLRAYEILAGLHLSGSGVAQDTEKGVQLLDEARTKGSIHAAVKLGKLLRVLRRGGDMGEGRTYDLWREAAEKGYGPAQYLVAKDHELRYMGMRREPDRAAALAWYAKAFQDDDPTAEEDISVTGQQMFCDIGWRIENSLEAPAAALAWYERCAQVGCKSGMERLARAYASGELGLTADRTAGASWQDKARHARGEGCLN